MMIIRAEVVPVTLMRQIGVAGGALVVIYLPSKFHTRKPYSV